MRRDYLHAATLCLILFLAGCSSTEQEPEGMPDGPVAVSLTAGIADATDTRVVNGQWEANDSIGLCMNSAGSMEIANEVFNYCYKVSAAGSSAKMAPAEAAKTAYFPADGSKVDFLAYHPYRTGGLTASFTLPVDVSLQPATDLLTARTNGHDRSLPAISLSFGHRLVKLKFTLKGSGIISNDQLAGASLVIKGMNTKATCQLADGSITDAATPQEIIVPLNTQGTAGEAIVLPRRAAEGISYVVTLADGTIYTAYMSASQELKAGTQNTFHLTLRPVPTTVSATVEPWKDGDETDLTSSVVVVTTSPETSAGIAGGTAMGIRGIGERGTDNAHYTYDGTNWQATVPLWWDTLGDKANLYAWLPANEQNQPDDNHLLLWNIPTDQSEGYAAGDLLISHNVSNLPTGEPAALRFGHVLSSVTLELLPGIGFTADDLPRATLLLNGYPTQVTADIRTATLSKAGAPADITPVKDGATFRVLLVPCTKTEGELMATVSLDGGIYPCRAKADGFSFLSGKHHTLRLTLNKTGVVMSGSVSPWEEGSDGDFTIQ